MLCRCLVDVLHAASIVRCGGVHRVRLVLSYVCSSVSVLWMYCMRLASLGEGEARPPRLRRQLRPLADERRAARLAVLFGGGRVEVGGWSPKAGQWAV